MADQLTPQQLEAVNNRGGKLLVSAAAGSGKTKVLVTRLLSYLTDPVNPANIDDFLIITYTKAAAAELRAKIAAELSERITEQPENQHLLRQLQRLYLAKISTVHAFCTDLIKDYAYRLDVAADFRVAEENECLELQDRVMTQLLDEAYENISEDADFAAFVDTQGLGRDDRQVPSVILQLYNSARCHLDPEGWLDNCLAACDVEEATDAAQTVWGKYLMEDLREYLQLHMDALGRCVELAKVAEGMEKPAALLADTLYQLQKLYDCDTWDAVRANMAIDYGRLTFTKKCTDTELIAKIKAIREACKKGLERKLRKFSDDSAQILADTRQLNLSTKALVRLCKEFSVAYAKVKRARRVLDFSDLEHIALDLLLGKSRSGATAIAREVGERFREVMVDEYQDSNAVQDAIFTAITQKRNNCFMVGDVKQSIYQFRLADPGIFLEKYNTFAPAATAQPGEGRKVILSSNFRSAAPVVDAVNHVFETCMSVDVGGLDYGEDEMLREGVPHSVIHEPEIELHALEVQADAYSEEADFVAQRICQLLDGTHMIRQKDQLRPIAPEDIVILLRSPGSVGGRFAKALEAKGIRCSFGGSVDVLQTEEVQTLRSLLQVIDNPLLDIPLTAVLLSRVFAFSADDLAAIRSGRKGLSMYAALKASNDPKAEAFVELLKQLRRESRMNDLSGLLNQIFAVTAMDSIYAAMPDGELRLENIQVFCQLVNGFETSGGRSLCRFLAHLEALDEKGIPGAAEQTVAGAVTIMSIHKSKGLEFPVVFLSGLARAFNRESIYSQILCDKQLGIGLNCVNKQQRVRYPSIAKRAIAAKMLAESVSEELRILYVAMTRPKDRLIMTYADRNLENVFSNIVNRMDLSDRRLLTAEANCPGDWILLAALCKSEAGAFFKLGGYPANTQLKDNPWHIAISALEEVQTPALTAERAEDKLQPQVLSGLAQSLDYQYPHRQSTLVPSKQTATQIKGRQKDNEVAEGAAHEKIHRSWRAPTFAQKPRSGKEYGNALHKAMQYIRFGYCGDLASVVAELDRLADERFISQEQRAMVDADAIAEFFRSDLGIRLANAQNVVREFKFSILDDAKKYFPDIHGESVLLQGVVDCAIIESDGITIVDFKTDKVSPGTLEQIVNRYKPQVQTYADALRRIYGLPVKKSALYFFSLGTLVDL